MIRLLRDQIDTYLTAVWEDVPYYVADQCQTCEHSYGDKEEIACGAEYAHECPVIVKLVEEYIK